MELPELIKSDDDEEQEELTEERPGLTQSDWRETASDT